MDYLKGMENFFEKLDDLIKYSLSECEKLLSKFRETSPKKFDEIKDAYKFTEFYFVEKSF